MKGGMEGGRDGGRKGKKEGKERRRAEGRTETSLFLFMYFAHDRLGMSTKDQA